jgi:uncharacterized surface protein with fasciclin (FAS1) repeats
MNIKKIVTLLALLFISISLFTQCTKEKTEVSVLETLDAKLSADPELSLLKAAIAQAKLETFTKGPGPFTILAPTNTALNVAGITTASLPTIDSLTLSAFVLNHFQNLKRTNFEFPNGPNAPMLSIAGFNNFSAINKSLNKIYVNGATILQADITCSNGIIHKLNKALPQPVFSIRQLLKLNPNYTLMDSAISKAGLNGNFAPSTAAPITIFVIDNATMIANGYTNLATIGTLTAVQTTTLSNILKYHIIPSRNFSVAMVNGNLKTALNSNVLVATGATVSIKGISNPSPINLAGVDILGSNGVIHEITDMLKP